jgi:subtilisin family serine protease
LLIEHEEGPILVVPGTQAISVEGLEVLSLGVELPNADRVSVAELVNYVQAAGGVPVIPWGVGKWIGRRGKLVEGLLQNKDTANNLLLADNANRPWWWPYPKLLKAAARANRSVVSGSDPLPVRGDEVRIGSGGVLCDVDSKDTAWPQIRQYLDSLNGADVATFGDPMASTQLWHKQISLRMASKV